MKFKQGWIANEKGVKMDVVVDSKTDPVKVIDLCLGIGSIAFGVIHLMRKSFRSGSQAFESAEFKTFKALDLVEEIQNNKTE